MASVTAKISLPNFALFAALSVIISAAAYAEEPTNTVPQITVDIAAATESEALPSVPAEQASALIVMTPSRNVRVQLPGFSHHFSDPIAAKHGKKWNEKNYGIGLEFRDPVDTENWNRWSTLKSAGLMKDSLGAWGGYATVTLQKRIINNEYTVDAGPALGIFWRTFNFGGPHRLMPAILPSLSIEHKKSGWGINSILIPGFKWRDRKMPTVLWVGITKSY